MHSDSGIGGLFFVIVMGFSLVWVLGYNLIRILLPKKQQQSFDKAYNNLMQFKMGRRGRW